jgi:hypothetical protein
MSDDAQIDAWQSWNDAQRKSEPIGSDDTWSKLHRLNAALCRPMEPADRAMVQRERDRLARLLGVQIRQAA